jgi:glucose/arabinose dehydrogenase
MILRLVAVGMMLVGAATPALAQLKMTTFVSGLTNPVGMVQDPSDPTVQYVIEQQGKIKVIKNGTVLATPFLDLTGPNTPVRYAGDERGLLGLALPHDYASSGRAYVYYTSVQGNGDSILVRYKRSTSDPLTLDPASAFPFEFSPGQRYIVQPFGNHKGGKLAFGPDGYLYVGLGDGGDGGDPGNRAQDPNTLLGKILRLDVSVPDGNQVGYAIPPSNPFVDNNPIPARGEIWDFGVRNPWRFTFDEPVHGGTGAMLIADVGQGAWEEIDYEPAGRGGRNYGWAIREGAHPYSNSKTPAFTPFVDPIWNYDRDYGQSITGGYVYRGLNLGPAYRGRYFFSDYVARKVASISLVIGGDGEASPTPESGFTDHTTELGGSNTLGNISSIDVDASGEIYLVSRSKGSIFKLALVDADNDTLPDGWEVQFGLNPASAAGADGASGDPDGDGQTNAQELAAGTHPTNVASLTRYLAEGSSSSFFETVVDLANPGTQPASVLLRFLRMDGIVITHPLTIAGQRHATIRPADYAGLQAADFSTVIETDREVAVERTMTWTGTGRYGSHMERAVKAPSTTWYLAEGATHGAFDLFYLLANPSDSEAHVNITYLRPDGAAPIVRAYNVGAHTRVTIPVDLEQAELEATDVSASITVTNGVGIIVERAMYRTSGGVSFMAGHDSAGVTAPAGHWFFAEGATGEFFDLFLLLANPTTGSGSVTVRYLLPDGAAPVTKTYTLPAQSRTTINVEGESPLLASTPVAMVVESNVAIVAERSMYWPGPSGDGWLEASNSPGTTETGITWVVAGGESGGPNAAQTYVLVANTSAFAGTARVTVLRENGAPLIKEFALQPDSRTNVPIDGTPEFASAIPGRYGVLVESLGATPAQIVVERASYSNDAAGTVWAAGGTTLGTRLQ